MNTFKNGDYTIHIFISKIILNDPSLSQSPMVKITCFNTTKQTSPPTYKNNSFTYNEHLYFSQTNCTKQSLSLSTINLSVYDYNTSLHNANYICIHEFDIEHIYTMNNHCLTNTYLAMTNPQNDDISNINGYIQLSISVLNDSLDNKVNFNELEMNNNNNNDCNVIIPPQIKGRVVYMNIIILKAEGLYDINSECNCYIECVYNEKLKTTNVKQMVNNVIEFNEVIHYTISIPCFNRNIMFYIKDKNTFTKDEVIGSFQININDVILYNKYNQISVADVYGASGVNNNSTICNEMNTHADIASYWKGKVYFVIKQTDNNDNALTSLSLLDNIEHNNYTTANTWFVSVKLYNAVYLPTKTGNYAIRVCIQEDNIVFPMKNASDYVIEWNCCKEMSFNSIVNDIYALPDVFIYLEDGKGNKICFQRFNAKYFYNNKDVLLIKLLPEPCINKITHTHLSGVIKLSLTINNKPINETNNLLDIQQPITNVDPYIDTTTTYTLVINIHLTRYLPNTTNDIYITINHNNTSKRTNIKSNSNNSIWNEQLIFPNIPLNPHNSHSLPIFLLKVINNHSSQDTLHYTYLILNESSFIINSSSQLHPQWYQLFNTTTNLPQGQILLSFMLFDNDHLHLINQSHIQQETITYTAEINVLGLRRLKPLGLIPVKKAYIEFDLSSVDDKLTAITTDIGDSGDNPNINTVIKFDMKLPRDERLLPEMQCNVYEYMLGGLYCNVLGRFSLNLSEIIKETKEMFEQNITRIKELNEEDEIMKTINESVNISNRIVNTDIRLIDDERKYLQSNKNDLKQPLMINTNGDRVSTSVIEMSDLSKVEYNVQKSSDTCICSSMEDLNYLYKGSIDNDVLNKEKYNSKYFVIKSAFHECVLPMYEYGESSKDNNKEMKMVLIENNKEVPDYNLYFPLGYNRRVNNSSKEGDNNNNDNDDVVTYHKHYRRIFNCELENVNELDICSPFKQYELTRNDNSSLYGDNNTLSNINNKILNKYPTQSLNNEHHNNDNELYEMMEHNCTNSNSGVFKGLIKIASKTDFIQYNSFISSIESTNNGILPQRYNFLKSYNNISQQILTKHNVITRIYILELRNLPLPNCTPYITINQGNKQLITTDKLSTPTNNSHYKWYKHYDILTELPGTSTITIQVYAYDPIFPDELIGETTIDIEDRYFDSKWQALHFKPIETRSLKRNDTQLGQGEILLWIEIIEQSEHKQLQTPWYIQPQPCIELICVFIVYETEDLQCLDVEGTSDVYVSIYTNVNERISTDIHYRCTNGNASFNYRLILPIHLPQCNGILHINAYDNDILSKDDYIGGTTIDLTSIITDVTYLDLPIHFTKTYIESHHIPNIVFDDVDNEHNKFWLTLTSNNNTTYKGRILCSLELTPLWKHKQSPVGIGRTEPNRNPYLPPPLGRITFNINPFKSLTQLVGVTYRNKILKLLCIILCIIYLCCFIPYITLHISAELLNPFNYIFKSK